MEQSKQNIVCKNCEKRNTPIIQSQLPKDENTAVWRYMTIGFFEKMIETSAIYVSPIGGFSDLLEGQHAVTIWEKVYRADFSQQIDSFEEKVKSRFYCLCFHQRAYESELMWRSYCDRGGVALKTSVERLKSTGWKTAHPCPDFYVLAVEYLEQAAPAEKMPLHPIAVKQVEYEGENEIRMIFSAYSHNVKDTINMEGEVPPPNIYLHFTTETFLGVFEQIVFSPGLPNVTKEGLKSLVKDRLGQQASNLFSSSEIVR